MQPPRTPPLLHSLTCTAALCLSTLLHAETGTATLPASKSFTLRENHLITYDVNLPDQSTPPYLEARLQPGAGRRVWFGPRLVLQLHPSASLESVLQNRPLPYLRFVQPHYHLLDAGDAWTALRTAAELADHPEVQVCRPVIAQDLQRLTSLAPRPKDPRYPGLWHLENRWPDGTRRGPDLGGREAWFLSRGQGVVVAVADDGIELSHPDLAPASSNPFHFNFTDGTTNAQPTSVNDYHATVVAGFVAARDNNDLGITGLAPRAGLASWKIFNGNYMPPAFEDELMDMFQFSIDQVFVQNHSWGSAFNYQLTPSPLEQAGIDRALDDGRSNLGVLMVRAAGNGNLDLQDANDDGYANDPRVVTVASVESSGRPAEYSNPGACILVAGFGGADDRALTTTDRQGTNGLNTLVSTDDSSDYYTSTSLQGTSFSTPQISGLIALLLAYNPTLTIRDVQCILALASRPLTPDDPDLIINGAGFRHSHHTGFGLPHAGTALSLARNWATRPPLVEHEQTASGSQTIPDDGLRLLITGRNVPSSLRSIPSTPGMGPHPDSPTAALPIVDVGLATTTIATDLHGKAALIQRSPFKTNPEPSDTFESKIHRAAEAGAAFAIVRNERDSTDRVVMRGTDLTPIPAVMIDQVSGEALAAAIASDPELRGQLQLSPATYTLPVTVSLACEHVGLRVHSSHPRRRDVRITLVSPQGTRSVLQHINTDPTAGPTSDWTYWSTRHYGESSQGTWRVEISDESPGDTGSATEVRLLLRGIAITDSDQDGLDDTWETAWFSGLQEGPAADPDRDGWSNAQEQILQSNPVHAPDLNVFLSQLDPQRALITWNTQPGALYELQEAATPDDPFSQILGLEADTRELEAVLPMESTTLRLFRVLQH